MQKVIRDGKVAVLYSPGWGSGWYTYNREVPQCLFDPAVVAWVENGKKGSPLEEGEDWESHYGVEYFNELGLEQLKVDWIPEGTVFRIEEYDGYESVDIFGQSNYYLTA